MMNCMMGMGMMGFLGLLLVLVLGAAVLAVIWLVQHMRASEPGLGRQQASSEAAQEILKLRYVRGEIDADTYVRMKRELAEE